MRVGLASYFTQNNISGIDFIYGCRMNQKFGIGSEQILAGIKADFNLYQLIWLCTEYTYDMCIIVVDATSLTVF